MIKKLADSLPLNKTHTITKINDNINGKYNSRVSE
jgi:hypothetical protein